MHLHEMIELLSETDLKGMLSKMSTPVKILDPGEYPKEITATQGAFTPDVQFAGTTSKGMYYVDHQGAGHMQVYWLPKRKGSRPKTIGGASSLEGAMKRILNHDDETANPNVPREQGKNGPVNMFSLGKRL